MMAAPTARAKIAVWEVRDLGEPDIKALEDGRAPGGARRPVVQQARPTARVEPRPFYPERALARSCASVRGDHAGRATMRPMAGTVRAALAALGPAARGAGRPAPPTAPSRSSRRPPPVAPGLDVRAAADPRPAGAAAWWLWAVRRVNAVHPAQPGPAPPDDRVPRRILALAFALLSGIGRYDTALFSVHMVQHVLLMLVAAPLHRAGRARDARPAASLVRDPPSLAAAGPPFARRPVPGLPGHGLGHVRGDDVGRPLLGAVQRLARGPGGPRPRARPVPDRRAPLLVAGGRARSRAVADEPPGPRRLPVHRR